MCLLSYFPEGIMPDEEHLWNGAYTNEDGFGYAIATKDGTLITHKGLDAYRVITQFMAERERHPEGPAMFHSRFATSGKLNTANCHPFQVGNDRQTVIAHNGIFFQPKGKRSDTRVFAEDVMPYRFPALDSKRTRRRLEGWMGSFNKLAVITVNPAYKHNGYLFNEKEGHWVFGAWHSNYGYTPPARTYYGSSDGYVKQKDGTWKWEPAAARALARDTGLECLYCGERAVDEAVLFCTQCRTCQDCGEDEEYCQCYVPHSLRGSEERDTEAANAAAIAATVREEGEERMAAIEAASGRAAITAGHDHHIVDGDPPDPDCPACEHRAEYGDPIAQHGIALDV